MYIFLIRRENIMICQKCNTKNQDDSMFCKKCGEQLQKHNEDENKKNVTSKFLTKKNTVMLSAIVVVVISSLLLFVYFNDSLRQYKSEIRNNNYTEANQLYKDEIEGNTKKENQVKVFLTDEVSKIKNDFIKNKMEYNTALNNLKTIENTELTTTDAKNAVRDIKKLNTSRISYKKGLKFLDSENYIDAIKEFDNVIDQDTNYELAQEQIQELSGNYKSEALIQAESYVSDNEYEEAISLLKEANSVIPNDSEIISKLEVFEGELKEIKATKRQEEIEDAKSKQIVIVENAKIVEQSSDLKALYPDMIQVLIQNNSDKTIKNFEIGVLGFDNNGYPLKIRGNFDFSDGRYEFLGNAEDVNIVAGDRFGENVGWELDDPHGISKILATVKSVTFYDGSSWNNAYYDYWIEEYKEKPLE